MIIKQIHHPGHTLNGMFVVQIGNGFDQRFVHRDGVVRDSTLHRGTRINAHYKDEAEAKEVIDLYNRNKKRLKKGGWRATRKS